MILDTPNETEAAETPETLSISEPSLSFTDYERVRRGESVPKAPSAKQSAPGEKSPEQKETPESETEETEEPKETEDETEGEGSDEDAEAKETDKQASEKPRKKNGIQRRVDKLNQRISAAQQDAEYWKREALKNATASKEPAKSDTANAVQSEGEPNADDYDAHAQFVRALTRWEVQQAQKADKEAESKSKLESDHKQRVHEYVTRRDAFQAKTPDFDEVMEDVEGIRLSPAVESVLLESENGPELAYELAKNREELTRICKLAPLAAAREIGKLESKLSQVASSEKKPEAKQITKASKPLEPVKASGKGSVKKSIDDPALSFSEYEKLRREQMKRK